MKSARFRGLFPIVHTPFTPEGEVDFDSLRRLAVHVSSRSDGMVFPGFASEFWRLTDDEISACAGVIAGAGQGNTQVVLNVTSQATVPAIRSAEEFARMGATALMLLPPFLVPSSAAAIESHLDALLAATSLPCIVQDSAGLTGMNFDPQSLARMKEKHSHFAAIKVDQVPTGPSISRYRAVPSLADLSYLVGYSGVQMLDAARRGATGLMGGCGHLDADRRMLDALLGDDAHSGFREFARLAPLLNFEMQSLDLVIHVHKHLLYEAGIIATPVSRAPCRGMDSVHAEELRLHAAAVLS